MLQKVKLVYKVENFKSRWVVKDLTKKVLAKIKKTIRLSRIF